MKIRFAATALLALGLVPGFADEKAKKATPKHRVLVELFSSQG